MPRKHQFAIRPRPLSGELFKGYLLRLAWEHGYESLYSFHKAIGVPFTSHYDSEPAYKRLTDLLAPMLRLEPDELCRYFMMSRDSAVNQHRAIEDIRLTHPCICIECIKELPFIDERWQLAHHTHCTKHHLPLTEQCPQCGHRLLWRTELFDGCTNPDCSLRWQAYSLLPSKLPGYLTADDGLSGSAHEDYRCKLYQALVCVIRPLDAMFDSFQTFPDSIEGISLCFEQAYALLTDDVFRRQWVAMRETHFNEHSMAKKLGLSRMKTLNSAIENLEKPPGVSVVNSTLRLKPTEQLGGISAVRKKLLTNVEDARFQLSLVGASSLLDVSPLTITALVDNGNLVPICPQKMARALVFDLRVIADFVAQLTTHVKPLPAMSNHMHLIQVSKLALSMPMFDIENNHGLAYVLDELIEGFQGGYSGEFNSEVAISELWLEQEQILKALEERFISSLHRSYPKTKIRTVCGFSEKQYIAFREVFHEKLVLAKNQHRYISPETLQDFFSSYVLLNRWCKVRGIELSKAVVFLKESGANFIFPELQENDIYIIDTDSYEPLLRLAMQS